MKKEDPALEEIIKQLRLENAEAKAKLEKQKAIESRYEESLSRFEAIFNQSMLGNKIIDPDLRINQVNEALQQMLGYTAEELSGTKITTFAHPDSIPHWKELQKSLWEENIPTFQIETSIRKKDGAYLWCQVSSILFQDQGISLGYTIVEDISNRKSLELELKRLYENQETMMHMVAHDLKSPLFNIKLATGFLKENLKEMSAKEKETQEESLSFVKMITDTSDKTLSIIDDLIIIGEVEAVDFTSEEVNLKPFIKAFLDSSSLNAQNKNIQVEVHAPDNPVYGWVDPDKFRRVLENLVSNAIKFSKPEGKVVITLKQEEGKALMLIQDNGIGIPAKLVPSIFDKFTQARRKGTQGEPTTGLGLFIVKQIIEKQGGKIWVESHEDVKTTFYIQLNSD
ncbi:PAS domain-containing sensor histidine kinase [Pontibacter pamirensis]|uniref:PAS domain-containing sensor histidine kinase n=1 Tax=Pontibacter pamirensis TaxID=2562824 RepID=UPI00138A64A5|nr:PAS domain-containing sensor histidine kinase [Pontibacter pamirensis]